MSDKKYIITKPKNIDGISSTHKIKGYGLIDSGVINLLYVDGDNKLLSANLDDYIYSESSKEEVLQRLKMDHLDWILNLLNGNLSWDSLLNMQSILLFNKKFRMFYDAVETDDEVRAVQYIMKDIRETNFVVEHKITAGPNPMINYFTLALSANPVLTSVAKEIVLTNLLPQMGFDPSEENMQYKLNVIPVPMDVLDEKNRQKVTQFINTHDKHLITIDNQFYKGKIQND